MATFSSAQFRTPKGKVGELSSDYNLILEQMETVLAKDGVLSAADYATLAEQARNFANLVPTRSARNNFLIKAESYKRQGDARSLSVSDVSQLRKDFEDDRRKLSLTMGDNPKGYVENISKSLQAKLEAIQERLFLSEGGDNVDYSNEYNATIAELDRWNSAIKAAAGGKRDALQAIAVTDPDTGDIIQIEYVPVGAGTIKGAKATDSTIDGIPLYLVPNRISHGMVKANFLGQEFSAPDIFDQLVIDPETKLPITPPPLTSNSKNKNYRVDDLKGRVVNSFNRIKYGIGMDGKTYYERNDDGTYKRYDNVENPAQLGINPQQAIKLPTDWESRLAPRVVDIIKANELPRPQELNVAPIPRGPMSIKQSQAPVAGQLEVPTGGIITRDAPQIQESRGQPRFQKTIQNIVGGIKTGFGKIFNFLEMR